MRAHTFSIKYYVSAYKRHGFNSVRRILRTVWEPKRLKLRSLKEKYAKIDELRPEDMEEMPRVFVESIKPYWNWWIEEYGGEEVLEEISRSWFEPSESMLWLVARKNGEIIGLTGFYFEGRNFLRSHGSP